MLFDEPATLEPDDILAWYELCSEGLERERQDTHRRLALQEEIQSHLSDILPIGATQSEIDDYFSSCQEELDLSAVLTLAASAEARIRLDAALRRKQGTDQLSRRLDLLRGDVDSEWRVPLYDHGIVDAWKAYLAAAPGVPDKARKQLANAIGRFKEILGLRHWVAHGRYWEPVHQIGSYPPVLVARHVNALYDALREIASYGKVMDFA